MKIIVNQPRRMRIFQKLNRIVLSMEPSKVDNLGHIVGERKLVYMNVRYIYGKW